MANEEKRNIVIIGGGIIGCTTAYFLTRHPSFNPSKHSITLLEASEIAGGASGKAGGLLALWAYPNSIVPLSYYLHASLAAEHDGPKRWGYRRVHCGQLSAKGRPPPNPKTSITSTPTVPSHTTPVDSSKDSKESVSLEKRPPTAAETGRLRAAGIPSDLTWFSPSCIQSYDEMGDPSTTAQVHPYLFTTSMAELAAEKGVKIHTHCPVSSINYTSSGAKAVESVTYTDNSTSSSGVSDGGGETRTISCTDLIIAAGPWTKTLLPKAPITALRAHSVTIRPSNPISAFAIFTEISLPSTSSSKTRRLPRIVTPEIYARPNNEAYCCGEGDTLIPLPSLSSGVETDLQRCQEIVEQVGSISDELRDGEVLVRQACYLPNTEGNVQGPLIGGTGVGGEWIAAGHTCWGIQNGPGTGKVMSEFVFDGKVSSARIGGLEPRRWM